MEILSSFTCLSVHPIELTTFGDLARGQLVKQNPPVNVYMPRPNRPDEPSSFLAALTQTGSLLAGAFQPARLSHERAQPVLPSVVGLC